MALDSQVIGQLDSNKGDASLALGGNIPFVPIITDQTIKVFQDLTNKDIKKREDEYQNWEKGVATKIAEVSKIDNVLDADRELLGKKKGELIKEIQNKAYLLHPSNQVKHRGEYDDLMTKVNEFVIDIDKSKQDATLDKEYRKGMRDKAEWANPINESRYQKWRATPMSEREPFALMADPSSSMTKRILEAQKGAIQNQTTTYQYSPDNAMVTVKETATLDPERYYNALRTPEEEAYYKAYYRDILTPQQKQELASAKIPILTEDDYAKSMYMKTFTDIITLPSKTTPNPEYLQEQAYKRAQLGADTRIQTTGMNVEGRKDIKQMEIDAKRNELTPKADINSYSVLKPINDNIDSLQSNIAGSITLNADLAKQYPTIKSVKEVESRTAFDDITRVMYDKDRKSYGNAYGKIYIVDDKKEGTYYLPAKVFYTDKNGNEIDKKLYLADKVNSKEVIMPDVDNKFTKEKLLGRVADNTVIGKAQYNKYVQAVGDLDEFDKSTTQPSSSGRYRGVNEMFYTPIGLTIDRGVERNGILSNPKEASQHNDHVHLAFDDAGVAVEIMDEAKRRGLSVRGNTYAGKNTHSKNTSLGNTSAHGLSFENGVGKGADIGHENTDKERKEFFMWVKENYGSGKASGTQSKTTSKPTQPKKTNTYKSPSGIKFTVE